MPSTLSGVKCPYCGKEEAYYAEETCRCCHGNLTWCNWCGELIVDETPIPWSVDEASGYYHHLCNIYAGEHK